MAAISTEKRPALSPGAVRLPRAHLSARVAWHDTDWTGRVCRLPAANHACTILRNVKERKDADAEEEDAGRAWSELDRERVPPCVFERASFMRPVAFTIVREHRYAGGWTPSHAHFAPTAHRMPAYSFEATPYGWMLREGAEIRAAQWGIAYDTALEESADQHIATSRPTVWVQDHRNQLALLDSFFSAIEPKRSLVLVYAKDVPLLEDRVPGSRVLIGAGIVTSVGSVIEWDYSGKGPIRSVMWERTVGHSIRPTFEDGFLLPYHGLLDAEDIRGTDLQPFVAMAPREHFEEFSNVSEPVSDDAAIAALLELTRVVDLLPGVMDGPWDRVSTWLSDRLADAWTLRGPYPGLGAALTAAGMARGALVAHRVVESLPAPGEDPWPALAQAIDEAKRNKGVAKGLVGRMALRAWESLNARPERLRLLRLLSRFALTAQQARRLFDTEARTEAGIEVTDSEIIENPYLLYEGDRGRLESISVQTIDRGLFPRDATARATLDGEPLPEPVTEAIDDRRVRALSTHLLELAALEGHTLLDEPGLRRRLSSLRVDPGCDPTSEVWRLSAEGFPPVLMETPLAGSGRGWQLARLREVGDLIASEVRERSLAGPVDASWDWRSAIDAAIEEPPDPDDPAEEAARSEKAEALSILARSRIAALVGPAGTGKTTMLQALCSHPDIEGRGVLLLAPTGKARVQLGDRVGARALTLAQYLRRSSRWHEEFGYRVLRDVRRTTGYGTVVIDEASMLTEEMLAAVLDSLAGVERFVLCGDHRQLPPIGAGRPFADLVKHLRDELTSEGDVVVSGAGLAELTVGRRQRPRGDGPRAVTSTGRDDLAVASWFSVDGSSPAADEAYARLLRGEGDGTLVIESWTDEDDLHQKLVQILASDLDLGLTKGDADALKRSLGATGTFNGRPSFERGRGGLGAENWQILSPVRSRPGGILGLNRLVRRTWRAGDTTIARKSWKLPPPLGADEILFHDKVMCITNHRRDGWVLQTREKDRRDVANGEIGMAVEWFKRKGIKVEFSTQPGLQYTFWADEMNSETDRGELLELAYAVTVHKSQGSQFGITFVVVPNPCPLLSPELLYTALTRQRERVALLVQGDPSELRLLASPWQSETGRRLTCLFRPADPFESPEGRVLDGSHVHRTARGEMVRSKSEVIVANILDSLGAEYLYEAPLEMPDGSVRLPDFTITRSGKPLIYWEHLGMLDLSGYRADWDAKVEWYGRHDVRPWSEGGGSRGTLVWSKDEGKTIDAQEIRNLAQAVLAT
jgi:hypothetical protein